MPYAKREVKVSNVRLIQEGSKLSGCDHMFQTLAPSAIYKGGGHYAERMFQTPTEFLAPRCQLE